MYVGKKRVTPILTKSRTDRLQRICDTINSLQYTFSGYKGQSLDEILNGLDVSRVIRFQHMCDSCQNLTSFPKLIAPNAADLQHSFASTTRLKSIDLSGFGDGTYDTYINSIFKYSGIESVKFSPNCRITQGTSAFESCSNLKSVEGLDLSQCEYTNYMFRGCTLMANHPVYNLAKSENATYMFEANTALTTIELENCKPKNVGQMFRDCANLVTIKTINLYSATSLGGFVYGCSSLENLTLKNIRKSIQIGGTTYGTLLTDESLINTAKELWDLTGSTSQTLTVSTTSNTRFDEIYVKLATPTAEQIAEDEYINNKKPCEVCESTDEGAMTLREYVVSKNWALA